MQGLGDASVSGGDRRLRRRATVHRIAPPRFL